RSRRRSPQIASPTGCGGSPTRRGTRPSRRTSRPRARSSPTATTGTPPTPSFATSCPPPAPAPAPPPPPPPSSPPPPPTPPPSPPHPPRAGAIHRVIPGLDLDRAAELAAKAFKVDPIPPASLADALNCLGSSGRGGPAFLLTSQSRYCLLAEPDPALLEAAMPA